MESARAPHIVDVLVQKVCRVPLSWKVEAGVDCAFQGVLSDPERAKLRLPVGRVDDTKCCSTGDFTERVCVDDNMVVHVYPADAIHAYLASEGRRLPTPAIRVCDD